MAKTITERFQNGPAMRSTMIQIAKKCTDKPYKPIFTTSYERKTKNPYILTYTFKKRIANC